MRAADCPRPTGARPAREAGQPRYRRRRCLCARRPDRPARRDHAAPAAAGYGFRHARWRDTLSDAADSAACEQVPLPRTPPLVPDFKTGARPISPFLAVSAAHPAVNVH